MHLETKGTFPARYAYNGPAFRFQPGEPDRPSQFLQAGVECLGVADRKRAEIEVLELAVEGVRATGLKSFSLKIGDLTLFSGLIDALDIPAQWRGRLKRHFWRPSYFRELLERLSNGAPVPGERYLASLGSASEADARTALLGLMDYLGSTPLGGRTREEIIDRLMEQAAEAAAIRLDKKAVALIERVLSVAGPARASLEALEKLGFDEKRLDFAARFGRNMEYYTGFVFELWSRDAEGAVQIAGGGRYDQLLKTLGAPRDVPAVGCAIRSERVLAARRKTGVV
jgi:ATP phosphoribosyltransferase regulatory subunit